MPRSALSSGARGVVGAILAVLLLGAGVLLAQQAPPAPPPPDQALSPDQLDDLVAPIALYPDPLLSQVLVAATYPLEVVQANQWVQKNPGMSGPALTQAAQQQNWDASVQALAVFPDVLKRLNDDVAWTTNLGNAFLAQQKDVMDAVQRMRQKAQQAGKLQSTAQENVATTTDGGQPYIDIEPANTEVIYVPVYDPMWIWGAPMWYPYPHWWWPQRSFLTGGLSFGFGGPIDMGIYFGAGWNGWGGWGWDPGLVEPHRHGEQCVHAQVQLQWRQYGQRPRNHGVGARPGASRGGAVCQQLSADAVSGECTAEHGASVGGAGPAAVAAAE